VPPESLPHLGGHFKTGHQRTRQNRPPEAASETGLNLLRLFLPQIGVDPRAPAPWAALKDVGMVGSLSRSAVTAAVSPRRLPQSLTGRFEGSSIEAARSAA
jgi:hypothetical protein